MANPVPAGSDVTSGTYRCTSCNYELQVGSTKHLPPCPSCGNAEYQTISGGDSVQDPQRSRSSSSRTSRSSSRASQGRGMQTRRTSDEPTKVQLYQEAQRLRVDGRSKMDKRQLASAVGRKRGRDGEGRSGGDATPIEAQAFLEDVNYPVRRAKLVDAAKRHGAQEEVRATLERLPDKQFKSPTEVSEAIGNLS